jgi:hypothetical protein
MKNVCNGFFNKIKNLWKRPDWFFDLLVALTVAFLSCLFGSTSLSPLFPATNYDFANLDSNFFLYSSYLLLQGRVPYLQVYDHKGLYHLAVDCLGLLIGGRYGVWFLEIVYSFVSILFLLRTVRIVSENSGRIYGLALAIFLILRATVGVGNLEGEWVLPFVSLFVFFYAKALVSSKKRYFLWGSFFMGLEVGLSLNSRPLDAIWGGAGAVYYLIYCLRHQKNRDLLFNASMAILGCALPFAVIFPLALQGGYLSAMEEAIWVQGSSYAWRSDTPVTTWFCRLMIFLYLLAVIGLFVLEQKKNSQKKEIAIFFLSIAVVTSLIYLPVIRYYNYIWSGLTFYAVSLSYSFLYLDGIVKKVSLSKVFMGFCLFAYLMWDVCSTGFYYGNGLWDFSYASSKALEADIVNTIPQTDRETQGQVFALNCDAAVYLDGDIIATERYFCSQSWWNADNPEVNPEVRSYLTSSSRPKWLVASTEEVTQVDYGDLIAAYYQTTNVKNSHFEIYEAVV